MHRTTTIACRVFGVLFLAALAILGPSRAAQATDLIFETDLGGVLGNTNFDGSGTNYGHRVSAAVQDGYNYGLAGGTTPNIVTTYGAATVTWNGWGLGYGDLINNVYAGSGTTALYEITFTADVGWNVLLLGLDLAGWASSDYTIANVSVLDGFNTPLFSQNNVLVEGDVNAPFRTSLNFGAGVQASTLKIQIDWTGAPDTYIGIDNILFSQVVPEPSTFALLTVGSLALIPVIRRRRK